MSAGDDSADEPRPDLIVRRSAFNGQVGYRLVEWESDRALVEIDIGDRHLNRGGVTHGGVIMTVIDAAGGYAGTHCATPGHTRLCVTASLTTEFLRPVPLGSRLTVESRRRGGGRTMFVSTIEVRDPSGDVVALGHGVYRYVGGSGDPAGIPGRQSTEAGDD